WPIWVRCVQVRAGPGSAHHRGCQPWRESERRGVLTDLAYGPEDWVSEAALLALVATAWTHPDAREDVSALVCWRFLAAMEASRSRPVTVLGSLARLVLATPQAPAELIGLAEEALSPDDEDGEEREHAPAPPRRVGRPCLRRPPRAPSRDPAPGGGAGAAGAAAGTAARRYPDRAPRALGRMSDGLCGGPSRPQGGGPPF